MIIGIVTTWFERGAAYVSKTYKELLEKEGHIVYIFARGGENLPGTIGEKWNGPEVTRSTKYIDTTIEKRKFYRWIKRFSIEAILFNEQQDFRPLIWIKKDFPKIKTAAYVDYYTEKTIPFFSLYDFLICNTKRHMQAMASHTQKYYIGWGTDIKLFKPCSEKHKELTFFHSSGIAKRKGTDILIDAFIQGELYKRSKLIIHTQIPIEKCCQYQIKDLEKYNIEVIEKTVPAPGLYHMGDIYVYPTRLDGLGLTMYEAIASGLPLITTDFPPMNEVGDKSFVRRVRVADYYCRGDAYYYPMVVCDKISLIRQMDWYIDHRNEIDSQKIAAREFALKNYNILERAEEVSLAFINAKNLPMNLELANKVKKEYLTNWNPTRTIMRHRFFYKIFH